MLEDKRSHYEPSIAGGVDYQELDESELYVPHFQRVSISGEDTSGVSRRFCARCYTRRKPYKIRDIDFQVPLEDLERNSKLIVQALQIREQYMKMSHQGFSATAARFLDPDNVQRHHDDKQSIEG